MGCLAVEVSYRPTNETEREKIMTSQIVIQVPMTEAEMDEYVGTECEEYQEGCVVCDTWVEWEGNDGVIDVMVNRDKLVNWILSGVGL